MSAADQPVLMVGAPSSGTSLLQQILARHSKLYAGYEMSLLNKHAFYGERFPSFRRRFRSILKHGCSTEGWQLYTDTLKKAAAYNINKIELVDLVQTSSSSREFLDRFFARVLEQEGKTCWIEKTPSNAYCIPEFLGAYPQGRVVHLYRHPLDVMASLRRRGRTPLFAALAWIYTASAALRGREAGSSYMELSYEELLTRPEQTVRRLCGALQVDYEAAMLEDTPEQDKVRIASWGASPMDKINPAMIGRNRHQLDELDHYALQHCAVSPAHGRLFGLPFDRAEAIVEALGYEAMEPAPASRAHHRTLRGMMRKDALQRYTRYALIDHRPFRAYPARLV